LESAKAYVAKLDSEYTHILHGEDTGVIEEAKLDATETMHRNFWNLPLHARTLYMEKILFPVKTDYLGDDATFDNFRKKALDFVLPVSDVKSVARRFLRRIIGPTPADAQALLNRDVAESYLDACEEGEQRLMLTAMVVANEPSQDAEDARPGRAACRTLEAIGPAGTKLAQAIHSHEATPEDIRADFAASKNQADPPYRWQLHELIDAAGLRPTIGRVGKMLGSGAYGITVKTASSAITLLRANVRARANREFDILQTGAKNLSQRRPKFASLVAMIAQARSMAKIETDMDMAARQSKEAQKHYEGLQVEADGTVFTFRTARWIRHGKDYKETGLIAGLHFNDLPTDTSEQKRFKTAAAKALLLGEIMPLLQGNTFDHDRHGGQQRIEGTEIGQFDFGAMSLEPPTIPQKKLFGRIIGQAFRDHVMSGGRKSVADTLVARLDKFKGSDADKTYLIELKRGLLATSDFRAEIEPEAAKSIMALAFSSPAVDPDIKRGMNKGMGLLSPIINKALRDNSRIAKVTILPERAPPVIQDNIQPLETAATQLDDVKANPKIMRPGQTLTQMFPTQPKTLASVAAQIVGTRIANDRSPVSARRRLGPARRS
jgi:hypothetical protein